MKKTLLLLLIISTLPKITLAQQKTPIFKNKKKPKIALVLSGGGAKGIAHIPLLQMIDSLGIVPDLVVGNSMGSIVGGLYAMGYSGDSIASIAKTANWDKLIGGTVSLESVSVEEKSEFGRYLIGTDIVRNKIKPTPFLISDQNLRAFLSDLTYPVYTVSDFNKLPIPFRAIATDIVNGKEIVLDHGNLAFAMRASMSIPGAFAPINYKNTLLIDGGVLNNFPSDVAKKLGADIIIGSDVGGGMVPKEELDNISNLLFQTGMLHSNLKNPENKALCDILIDHTPNLTYSTADFNNNVGIYEEGKIATTKNIDALVKLSEKLKKYTQQPHKLPEIKDEIILDTIIYNNISKNNLALVKARTNIQPHKKYTKQEVLEGLNRAMGTTIFSHITFNPYNENGKKGLQLNGFEKSKHHINGSLHYDNYHGVGLIVNYVGRNIIGAASRTLVTIDIAEEPRFRVQYQKNFSHDRNWWWRSEIYGQQVEQGIFIKGESIENMKHRYFNFNNQINRNINSLKSYAGFGIKFENTQLKPKINPLFHNNTYGIIKYDFNTIELNTHFIHNSFNNVFFTTHGTFFKAYVGRSIHNNVALNSQNSDNPHINDDTKNYTKLILDYEKRIPLSKKKTLIIGATGAFIDEVEDDTNNLSYIDLGVDTHFFIGGVALQPKTNNYVFPGLEEGELLVTQLMKFNIGLQLNPMNKIYITPHFNMATVGFAEFDDYIDTAFSPNGKWEESIKTSLVLSSGATLSYNSILGPINLDLSWVNSINKFRFFIGMGFNLNRSN